jgi:DNA repair protein RecO (recombination protein O)
MEWVDTALVLQVARFREADLRVRLLTPQKGIATAFAFGGGRSRRRFTGCLDSFNLILVRMAFSRTGVFLNVQEASLLEGPDRLRHDWRRQGAAVNCLRFVEALGVPPDGSAGTFAVTRGLLGLLENADAVSGIVPVLFRFRLASEQGYAPVLSACARCGRPLEQFDAAHVFLTEGMAFCPACRLPAGQAFLLDRGALGVLRNVQANPPDRWADSSLSSESGRQAAGFIDAFVRYHLNLEWSRGRFRKTR